MHRFHFPALAYSLSLSGFALHSDSIGFAEEKREWSVFTLILQKTNQRWRSPAPIFRDEFW